MKKVSTLIFILSLLPGCTFFQPQKINISALRPPSQLDGLEVYKHIEYQSKNHKGRYEAALRFSQGTLELRLFSELGQALGEIILSDETPHYSKTLPFAPLPLKEIARAISLSYWPSCLLEQYIYSSTWRIIHQDNIRKLYNERELTTLIEYSAARPWLGTSQYTDLVSGITMTMNATLISPEPKHIHDQPCATHQYP